MIKAIIFDLDGVLVDGLNIHEDALLCALKENGFHITRDLHRRDYAHLPTTKKLFLMAEKGLIDKNKIDSISRRKQELTKELIKRNIKPLDNVIYTLEALHKEYKLAVASNCIKENCEQLMKTSKIYDSFDIILSNEDVSNPKPDPEMFIKAMDLLNIKPEECLILEDSEVGLKAAYKSGAYVMEVLNPYTLSSELIKKRVNFLNKL